MRPPTLEFVHRGRSRLGRDVWKGDQLDQSSREAARVAADTAGGDAALVLERTLGNRLTTARRSLWLADAARRSAT